jgi:hypothetical protein
MEAARALGDTDDPRAARHLIKALHDDSLNVSIAVVRALERLRDPVGVLPMYELVEDMDTPASVRRAAADALVTLGLLRPERRGPSRVFMWLAGMVLVLVAAASAESIGTGGAIAVFAAGVALLVGYYVTSMRRGDHDGRYTGPDGDLIVAPAPDGSMGLSGWSGDSGDGGGGDGGGAM